MQAFQKILIVKLRALGDVIMATPVIANLRAAFPAAQIDFLTESINAPVLANHPGLDQVIALERRKFASIEAPLAGLRSFRDLVGRLRQQEYDLVIDLFGNPRSAILTFMTGAPVRAGFRFRIRRFAYNRVIEPRGDRVHEVEFNLDALRALSIPISSKALYANTAAKEGTPVIDEFWQQESLSTAKPIIGLNASGGWYTKRWPLEAFATLGDVLVRRWQAKIILLWGPGELAGAHAIKSAMQEQAILAPQTDLPDLAALLQRIHLLVSNDSGPLHLAAAVGTRVAGIYGPTNPELQGPWGDGHRAIVKADLACLGCNGVTCKIRTHDCMQKLEVGTVVAEVEAMLQEDQPGAAR